EEQYACRSFFSLRKLDDRPNFHRALAAHRNFYGDGDCLIKILCLDEEIATQLFMRLRKWTIGHDLFAITNPNTFRRSGRLKRIGGHVLAPGTKLFCELHGFVLTVLPLLLAPLSLFFIVNEQHVFHGLPSFKLQSCSKDTHQIVVGEGQNRQKRESAVSTTYDEIDPTPLIAPGERLTLNQ